MNWQHQEMAQQMFGEWALVFQKGNMTTVLNTYKRYLETNAPELVASLNEVAALDYFAKALVYRHYR